MLTLATTVATTSAHADALVDVPSLGRGTYGHDDGVHGGMLADLVAVGVMRGDRLAMWPDRGLGLTPGQPALAAARVGGELKLGDTGLTVVGLVDLAELLRPSLDGARPWERGNGRFTLALIDELVIDWEASRTVRLTLGQQRIPFSVWRTIDERDLPLGLMPQVVDRRTPDRRLGFTVSGDLGSLVYALGMYEDIDSLQLRHPQDTASRGAIMACASMRWTPLAPMNGSNPPGKVEGARGPLPTPREDPWFNTSRLSVDFGVLAHADVDGVVGTDIAVGVIYKWRWFSAVGELLGAGNQSLGADGELMVAPADWLTFHARAEWDGALAGGTSTLGGGLSWIATTDRRSRIAVVGWVRRAKDRVAPEDALLLVLATSL